MVVWVPQKNRERSDQAHDDLDPKNMLHPGVLGQTVLRQGHCDLLTQKSQGSAREDEHDITWIGVLVHALATAKPMVR